MIQLYMIKHPQSVLNTTHEIIGGRSNQVPLTDLGIRQAHLLGERFLAEEVFFDEVYSSPAERTLSGAKISLPYIGFPFEKVVVCDELQEIDQGDWTGKNRFEIYTPEVISEMERNHWTFKAPNGESQEEVAERIESFMERHVYGRAEEDLKIGLYGHGMAIRAHLAEKRYLDKQSAWKIGLENTAISILNYEKGILLPIEVFDDSKHLENIDLVDA